MSNMPRLFLSVQQSHHLFYNQDRCIILYSVSFHNLIFQFVKLYHFCLLVLSFTTQKNHISKIQKQPLNSSNKKRPNKRSQSTQNMLPRVPRPIKCLFAGALLVITLLLYRYMIEDEISVYEDKIKELAHGGPSTLKDALKEIHDLKRMLEIEREGSNTKDPIHEIQSTRSNPGDSWKSIESRFLDSIINSNVTYIESRVPDKEMKTHDGRPSRLSQRMLPDPTLIPNVSLVSEVTEFMPRRLRVHLGD